MTSMLRELRNQVYEAHRTIVGAGLVWLSFGNASAVDRGSGIVVIKPSGVPYHAMTPEGLVVVSLDDGRPINSGLRPSTDTPTHLELYRRYKDIGGIVHTHSLEATAWAQARRAVPPFGTTHADHFNGPIPITRPLSRAEIQGSYEEATGRVIIETLDGALLTVAEVTGILVASHGPFAWGPTAAAAADNAVAMETIAAMATRTLLVNGQASPVDSALLERHHERKHGPRAYYGQQD
jgi:L-ribulose-5-phosphate 4-epimerase